ncbi:3'-5' exonuclease [Patescibacteria group bacterium]|nr:3'-5' exonuclease [Patescibacteria group bacterium]
MDILILDTETTGIEPTARLVQLAYKNLTTGKEVNEFFKPPIAITFGSMATHHITEEMVADKPAFEGSATKEELAKELKDNILVAHNVLFDMNILVNEGLSIGKYIDTLRVARHVLESDQYSMQYLRYSLDLKVENVIAHDAWGDITVLISLFDYLKKVVAKEFSLTKDEDIYLRMIELTQKPVLLSKINFGKYKGSEFGEIAVNDRGYLEWLYGSESTKNEAEQNEDLMHTLKEYLDVK